MRTTLWPLLTLTLFIGCSPDASRKEQAPSAANNQDQKPPEQIIATPPIITNIQVAAAADLVESNPQLVILDVRTAEEFAAGHLRGATNVDFHGPDFDAKLAALDKETSYLVHCAVGGRSSKARDKMQALGFRRIYHLDGGFNAWKQDGQPVEE